MIHQATSSLTHSIEWRVEIGKSKYQGKTPVHQCFDLMPDFACFERVFFGANSITVWGLIIKHIFPFYLNFDDISNNQTGRLYLSLTVL